MFRLVIVRRTVAGTTKVAPPVARKTHRQSGLLLHTRRLCSRSCAITVCNQFQCLCKKAGFMLLGDHKVEEAATRFLRAVEVEPSHGISYYGLGKAIYHLGNPSQGE